MIRGRYAFGLGLLAAVPVCGGADQQVLPSCKRDTDCANGQACVADVCLARSTDSATWAIELVPVAESLFALREIPAATFPMASRMAVDKRGLVMGSVSRSDLDLDPMATFPARLALTFQSAISGKPDLQFETDGTGKSGGGPVEFSVGVPEAAIAGRTAARLRIIPSAPADRVVPPWTAMVQLPTAEISYPVAADMIVIEGVLEKPGGDKVDNYVARALLGERVVSNSWLIDKSGRFRLRIPRSAVPATLDSLTVDIYPADRTAALPRLLVRRVSPAKLNLGSVQLPTFALPETFKVPVRSANGDPIVGATLRFRTALPGAVNAEAFYVREVQSDRDGAVVPLIPGAAGAPRDYSVAVISAPGSEYASRCISTYAVAPGSTGGERIAATIDLQRKIAIGGEITRSDGIALAGVRITATRQGDTFAKDCASDVVSPPGSVNSAPDGSYRLMLEPGRYRLDYEPAPGAPSPLHVEEDVDVEVRATRNVTLPAARVADGMVVAPGAASVPVPGCEIKIWQVIPDAKPILRARTRSGDDGKFRVILPRRE